MIVLDASHILIFYLYCFQAVDLIVTIATVIYKLYNNSYHT